MLLGTHSRYSVALRATVLSLLLPRSMTAAKDTESQLIACHAIANTSRCLALLVLLRMCDDEGQDGNSGRVSVDTHPCMIHRST